MSEMDEQLGAILGNPQMMQTILSMAQSLGQDAASSPNTDTPHMHSTRRACSPGLFIGTANCSLSL